MTFLLKQLPWRKSTFRADIAKERDRVRVLEITQHYFPLRNASIKQVLEVCRLEKITHQLQHKHELSTYSRIEYKEPFDKLIVCFITSSTIRFDLTDIQHQIHFCFLQDNLVHIYVAQFGLEL